MLYDELRAKAAEILAQAEQVKAEEKQQAAQACRAMIASYGITARDLGLDKAPKLKAGPKPGNKIAAKYRDPASGATWSGRGKTPKWINGAADRSQYAI
jgi:DNA-binding protein H-NS